MPTRLALRQLDPLSDRFMRVPLSGTREGGWALPFAKARAAPTCAASARRRGALDMRLRILAISRVDSR